MTEHFRVPGPRDVRATLSDPDANSVVVACPPHPQMGGDRRDSRLRAVSDTLADRSIACLRFDYGPYDGGRAEVTDCERTLRWARDEFGRVGLFGYSFGGAVAVRGAAGLCADGTPPALLSVLAPAETLAGASVVGDVDAVTCPVQVVYGERDTTVDAVPVADRADRQGGAVVTVPTDHFYTGRLATAADTVADFAAALL